MKIILIALLILIPLNSYSEPMEEFSNYEGEFRLSKVSYGMPWIEFSGVVKIHGVIVFRFDMISETEFGVPMFADFVPDNDKIDLFPRVIEGRYPKSLDRISLFNVEETYKMVVGDDFVATSRNIEIPGIATLTRYSTTIECDSRQYLAELMSFKKDIEVGTIDHVVVRGC